MGKKIALNVLYNIGIFLCILIGYSGLEYGRYEYLLGAAFIGAILIILKVRLIKEIRQMQNKP